MTLRRCGLMMGNGRFGAGASAIEKTQERRYRTNHQLQSLAYPTSGGTARKFDFAYKGNNQLETLTVPGTAGVNRPWRVGDYVFFPVRCEAALEYRERLGLPRAPRYLLHLTIGNLK
jgi:hypothetical protein